LLDELLTSGGAAISRLAWLQRTPRSNKTSAILDTLDKIAYLQEHGVGDWDLSAVNPNRRKWLARKTAKARVNNLKKLSKSARHPQLAAFMQEALYTFTDALLDMFDARLWELHGECRLAFRKDRLAATKTINEAMTVLKKLGELYLDAEVDHALTEAEVRQALLSAERLTRPEDDAYTDYFAKRHRQVRNFSRRLLGVMTFLKASPDAGLLEGLGLVSEIHVGVRRKLPAGAPTAFVPKAWEAEVFKEEGLDWRSFEIAALWVLRGKLRSGDVYVADSRRYLQLERYLIPKRDWEAERLGAPGLLGVPTNAKPFLAERSEALKHLATQVDALLADAASVRHEGGRIVVPPVEAEDEAQSLTELRRLIDERLPRVDVAELLIEVDNLTGFSRALTHLGGLSNRGEGLLAQLYACILAQACNMGFRQMADASDLPLGTLLWCNRWYLRDETLGEAVTTLVNYHHALPLSSLWGGGVLSSSDGQRFPVRGDTRKARALPRYFGYGKGVTSYTWTSDQLSQFGAKVIPSTVRDATYVLDAILDNESDLDIAEHTTDTAGYTELIFGLFGMLGLTFAPRIRDLNDQQLYRPPGVEVAELAVLRPLLNKVFNEPTIADGWDEMMRVAASLKKGYCTASLLVSKLQAYPRQHPVARALQEYGRLEKTIHILRWYAEPQTRRRVGKQLNKGEALHYLRKAVMFGHHGELPGGEDETLDQQLVCLNLVTNAIVVYNTVYIARIADELRAEGAEVRDDDLAHLWPSRFAHINFLGKYYFDTAKMTQAH
jgi:TnpA family transposase